MISSDISSSGDTGEFALSPVDSHCSTVPLGRAFNGVKKPSRERPDSTERGIGPGETGSQSTIDVSTRDLELVLSKNGQEHELNQPFMRNDWQFVAAVIAGAFILVSVILFVIARPSDEEQVAEQTGMVEHAPPQMAEPAHPALAAPVLSATTPELVAPVHPLEELLPAAAEPAKPALTKREKAAARKKARPATRGKLGARPVGTAKASLSAKPGSAKLGMQARLGKKAR